MPPPVEPSREPSSPPTHALVKLAPNGTGHPRVEVTDGGIDLVRRMAPNAHSLGTIAAALGVSRRTLGEAMERQPELKEAFALGRAALETELAAALLDKARAGNLVAAIFLLKAMCGWREGEARDGLTKVAIQINLPPPLSQADYARMIDEAAHAPAA